jgi:Uma2 family endonuclease
MMRLSVPERAIVTDVLLPHIQRRAYPVVMPTPRADWTVELVHELPDDGNRYEVLDGVLLVSPAPSLMHQRAVGRLYAILLPYVPSVGLEVLVAPAAVTWSERTELQPDVLALPLLNGKLAQRFEDVGVLGLAVEVLSPSTVRTDRFTKRREYQRRGVPEYWIVDPASRSVERWRPRDEDPEILLETLLWQPNPDTPALTIDLQAYFRAVHGE